MNKYCFLALSLLLSFCACEPSNETITDEPLLENTVTVDSKITGGNILKTFRLTGLGTESFDMPSQTNAKWIALSPIINIRKAPDGSLFFEANKAANVPKIIANIKDKGADNFMLKPQISFELLGFDFWGDFQASSEEQWQEIEASFRTLLLAYAATSVTNPEVKILCIGNELSHFTRLRPNFFKSIAQEIKNLYPNLKLTYAANWDEYEHITFWDSVDYIGINPYFPLVNKATPSVADIQNAYKSIKTKLSNLSATHNKPILFTEYGFRSIDFAAWKAWELPEFITNQSAYNPDVQSNGYQAFFNTFWKEKWVAGGFFWVWEIVPQADIDNGLESNYLNSDWTINYKPVLDVIKFNYLN